MICFWSLTKQGVGLVLWGGAVWIMEGDGEGNGGGEGGWGFRFIFDVLKAHSL